MATFYLLPPRTCLERILTDVVARLLPGLPISADGWDVLLLHLAANSGWSQDLFLIPRDDLPEGEPLAESLRAHFGAEPGDRVIEVPLPRGGFDGLAAVESWTVQPVAVSVASAKSYNHFSLEQPSPVVSGRV